MRASNSLAEISACFQGAIVRSKNFAPSATWIISLDDAEIFLKGTPLAFVLYSGEWNVYGHPGGMTT